MFTITTIAIIITLINCSMPNIIQISDGKAVLKDLKRSLSRLTNHAYPSSIGKVASVLRPALSTVVMLSMLS